MSKAVIAPRLSRKSALHLKADTEVCPRRVAAFAFVEIQQRQAHAGSLQSGSAATRHNSAAAGIAAEVVIAHLEAKLAEARQRK
ncbi:hypothetical protein [Comamonas piscis]